MRHHVVVSSIFVTTIIFFSQLAYGQSETAADLVKSTTIQVVDRLKTDRDKIDSDPDHIFTLMEQLVVPHFDFHTMSRAVLGAAWRNASPEQQNAFLNEFKDLLLSTYASNLTEYSDNQITFHPEETRPNSRFVLVRTEVLGAVNNNPLPIDYRMHQVNGKWMVVDVAVDKVSLISTYRGSFRSEINNDGLDSLITKLAEKNNRDPL